MIFFTVYLWTAKFSIELESEILSSCMSDNIKTSFLAVQVTWL